MDYGTLKTMTLQAKKHPEMLRLTGMSSTIVKYIYEEILEGIEHERFHMPRRRSADAQTTIFTVRWSRAQIFINTHFKSNSQHVKCFKCANEKDAKLVIEAIRSAVSQVGLGSVSPRYERDTMQIFIELGESMI